VKKVAEDLYAEDKAEEELETKAPDGAPKEHEEPETTAPQKAPIPSFAGRTSHRDDDEAFMITS
jgi:hypothetical protein